MGLASLIDLANLVGDHETEDRLIESSLSVQPASFEVGRSAIHAMEPRWGGSYPAMGGLAAFAVNMPI